LEESISEGSYCFVLEAKRDYTALIRRVSGSGYQALGPEICPLGHCPEADADP
jgi:hypothetical protein